MNFAVKDITVEDVEAFDRLASLRSPNETQAVSFTARASAGASEVHDIFDEIDMFMVAFIFLRRLTFNQELIMFKLLDIPRTFRKKKKYLVSA